MLCRLSQSDDKDKVDVNKIHSTGEVVDKVSDKLRLLSFFMTGYITLYHWISRGFFVPHLMDEVDENS